MTFEAVNQVKHNPPSGWYGNSYTKGSLGYASSPQYPFLSLSTAYKLILTHPGPWVYVVPDLPDPYCF